MLRVDRTIRRKSHFRGEERRPFSYGTVHQHSIYDSGMNARFAFPEIDAYGRATYAQRMEHTGRRERLRAAQDAERERTAPLISRDGVRGSAALVLMAVVCLALGTVWLMGRSGVSAAAKQVDALQARIERVQAQITDLEEEYSAAAAAVDVGYKAVNLGMISTKGTAKIYLYAPEDAVMGPMEIVGSVNTSQLATIAGGR